MKKIETLTAAQLRRWIECRADEAGEKDAERDLKIAFMFGYSRAWLLDLINGEITPEQARKRILQQLSQ